MKQIYLEIKSKNGNNKFYMIGVCSDIEAKRALKHELAHSFYYINNDYRKEMNELIKQISPSAKKKLDKKLKTIYADEVVDDEIQAYMSSGLIEGMMFMKDSPKLIKRFKKVFKQFCDL